MSELAVTERNEIGVGMGPDYSVVQRNLALELVRVTEAAALASAKWLGKGPTQFCLFNFSED